MSIMDKQKVYFFRLACLGSVFFELLFGLKIHWGGLWGVTNWRKTVQRSSLVKLVGRYLA